MEKILSEHWPRWQTPMGCACGALSDLSPNWHAHHIAQALRAAGYGATNQPKEQP